jgi:hypothetical protein
MNHTGTLEQARPSAGRTTMRNALVMGVTVSALSFAAVPARAQVAVNAQIAVQRHPDDVQRNPDDAGWDDSRNPAYDEGYRSGEREGQNDARERKDYGFKRDEAYEDAGRGYQGWGDRDAYRREFRLGYESGYGRGYRGFGFGIQIEGGGSANEYGPYGYPERGYGGYAEWGYRNGGSSSLRAAFDFGRRDGYEAGIDAARFGRFEPMRHRNYRATRGWDRRYGGRDAYDVNYRNGFRAGYEEGYRDARRSRRW